MPHHSHPPIRSFTTPSPLIAPKNPILTPHSPALTSSALGLLAIAYNFLASNAYTWDTAAISATVISTTSTIMYACLLLWTHRRIVKGKETNPQHPRSQFWSDSNFYANYVTNMYPTATTSSRSGSTHPPTHPDFSLSEDDRINQQMALLLMNKEPGPSPDASSATFRIDLPEDSDERERLARSQELNGSAGATVLSNSSSNNNGAQQPQPARWPSSRSQHGGRPDSLGETQAWSVWQDRGRAPNRPSSTDGRSNHSRGPSREERRREIELGRWHP